MKRNIRRGNTDDQERHGMRKDMLWKYMWRKKKSDDKRQAIWKDKWSGKTGDQERQVKRSDDKKEIIGKDMKDIWLRLLNDEERQVMKKDKGRWKAKHYVLFFCVYLCSPCHIITQISVGGGSMIDKGTRAILVIMKGLLGGRGLSHYNTHTTLVNRICWKPKI